jgi:hypothetical protein
MKEKRKESGIDTYLAYKVTIFLSYLLGDRTKLRNIYSQSVRSWTNKVSFIREEM